MKDILKTEDDKELDFNMFHNYEDLLIALMYKNDSAFRKCQKVDGHLVLTLFERGRDKFDPQLVFFNTAQKPLGVGS